MKLITIPLNILSPLHIQIERNEITLFFLIHSLFVISPNHFPHEFLKLILFSPELSFVYNKNEFQCQKKESNKRIYWKIKTNEN